MTDLLLRPALTHALAARLSNGARINLTAAHGLGRRQTLADLRSILPKNMRVLYADMKFCLNDFPATLHELCTQTGLPDATVSELGQLIEVLAQDSQPTLLILHNLDLLRAAPHDALFDTALLPFLAHIAAHPHLALLTVSEAVYPNWPLPCENIALPPQNGAIPSLE